MSLPTTPIDKIHFTFSKPITHKTIDDVNHSWNLDDVPDSLYGRSGIKYGQDIWGNQITIPDGYEMIHGVPIQIGDIHFDIYGGWVNGGEAYAAKNRHRAYGEGRWICWARKTNNE